MLNSKGIRLDLTANLIYLQRGQVMKRAGCVVNPNIFAVYMNTDFPFNTENEYYSAACLEFKANYDRGYYDNASRSWSNLIYHPY